MKEKYRIVSHTADLQIEVFGDSKEALFKNALFGMFDAIKPRYSSGPTKSFEINVTAGSAELLLVEFLSEALYLSDVHSVAFEKMDIQLLSDIALKATLYGKPCQGFEVVE